MKKVLFIFLVANLIFLSKENTALAQSDDRYADRGDRYEGIVEKFELVAGEKIVLLSAMIENAELLPKLAPAKYNLCFYLKDSAQLSIEVKEIEKLYLMTPKQEEYSKGLKIFSWSSKIPIHYKITLNELLPLAKIYEPEMIKVFPIFLYCNKPQTTQFTYDFCFIPHSTVMELNYSIKDYNTDQTINSGRLVDLGMEDKFHIRWNGKNNKNILQKEGWYYLNMEAEFEDTDCGSVFPPNLKFYHSPALLKAIPF